jgi:signal transduction histidine kinase
MFFGKGPTDVMTHVLGFRVASVRLGITFTLMRLDKPPSHDEPEWPSVLSAVLDALPELIATFDGDGRLRWINAAGIDLLGHAEEKLHELLLSDLYAEPDFERLIGSALTEAPTRGSWIGVASLVTADDTRIETHQRWLAHGPAEKKTLALTLVARPLQNARELELTNRRECLAAASLGLVHDMNNCMGPIAAYADLAATLVTPGSPIQRYLNQILRAAVRCSSLSTRLSDLSRDREPELTIVDMAEIAREIAGWLKVTRPDLSIEFSSDVVAATVEGDPAQLHQVVMNLAKNGVEALSDRAGSVSVRIDHADPVGAPLPPGSYLRLQVRDDGRGIEPTIQQRVFDPFFSTRPHGSGLGLAVTRTIVRDHNGFIQIERAQPRGTIATVHLPLTR